MSEIDSQYLKRIEYSKRYIKENPSKHTEYVRKYIAKNRDKINQKQREYYYKNKEDMTKTVVCDVCGGRYSKISKSIHMKTKKHNHVGKENQEYRLDQLEQNSSEVKA